MSVASAISNGSSIRRRASLQHPEDRREPEEQRRARPGRRWTSFHVAEWKKLWTPLKTLASHSKHLPDQPTGSERKPNVEGEQDDGEDEDAGAPTGPRNCTGSSHRAIARRAGRAILSQERHHRARERSRARERRRRVGHGLDAREVRRGEARRARRRGARAGSPSRSRRACRRRAVSARSIASASLSARIEATIV